ncbi:hypothetical protein [Streptomyces sp. NPDC060194]|uniref:hypothetical protein n=1 Tax=Streptomyces sp. NPDC060194 TaxID=3347069 RepID=UPI0036475AA1
MAWYRTRPGKVQAVRYDGTNAAAIVALLGGSTNARTEQVQLPGPGRGLTPGIRIQTFAQRGQARRGDWITTTGAGFKVMSDQQFTAQYEEM